MLSMHPILDSSEIEEAEDHLEATSSFLGRRIELIRHTLSAIRDNYWSDAKSTTLLEGVKKIAHLCMQTIYAIVAITFSPSSFIARERAALTAREESNLAIDSVSAMSGSLSLLSSLTSHLHE